MPRSDFANLMADVRIIVETDSVQKMQIGNLRRDLNLAGEQISVLTNQLEYTEDKLVFTEKELRRAKAWYNNKFMWFGVGILATVYLLN